MLRRWRDILLYSLVGAVVFEAALPAGVDLAQRFPIPAWYSSWFETGVIVLSAALFACVPLNFRWNYLRFFRVYPPLWTAVGIAVFLAAISERLPILFRPQNIAVHWQTPSVLLPLFISFSFALSLRHLLRVSYGLKETKETGQTASSPLDLGEWKDLKRWMAKEQPVSATGSDLFGHRLIAERIVEVVKEKSHAQNIALLGPFGSGKSSILNWIEGDLERSDETLLIPVRINCWAIPKAEDAPRVALEQIIRTLDRYVDAHSLSGLPVAYQRLISAEPSGMLHKLLTPRDSDPFYKLGALSAILDSLNARMILFIEDAERAGQHFEIRHFERLLWTLRNVKGVCFILAFDPHNVHFDYSKLCDVIEIVPAIDPERVFEILTLAYEHWMNDEPFVDPRAELGSREGCLHIPGAEGELARYARRTMRTDPVYAIVELLPSPRRIKHLLRRVDKVWNELRGEIDLDELIILTALRHGCQEAFHFLVENIDAARSDPGHSLGRAKTLKDDWKSELPRMPNSVAIEGLVDLLAISQLKTSVFQPDVIAPQGVRHPSPDYFRRMLAEQLGPSETSDQQLLREMNQWRSGDREPMMSRLLSSGNEYNQYANAWRHFVWRFTETQLLEIAESVIDQLLSSERATASIKQKSRVMMAILDRLHQRLPKDEGARWLGRQVAKALPISLGCANELFYTFAPINTGIVTEQGKQLVRCAVLEAARASYPSDAALLGALDAGHKASIAFLVTPPLREDPPDTIALSEWRWLAPHLIDAARKDPSLVVPEVALLVYDQQRFLPAEPDPKRMDEIYKLDRARTLTIFGDDTNRMLRILAEYAGNDLYAIAAGRAASSWLAGQ